MLNEINYYRAGKISEKIGTMLFYNTVIRIIIEGYMSLSLACFIGLATFDAYADNKGWPTFNIILSICLLVFILIIPVILYRIIIKNYG